MPAVPKIMASATDGSGTGVFVATTDFGATSVTSGGKSAV